MVNISIYPSNLDGLSRIYILEEESQSVFFEFDTMEKMKIACKNASKSWELCSDKRLPNDANEQLCFGFTIKESEISNAKINSIQNLIKRVNYWMGGENASGKNSIPVTSIKASQLKTQKSKMPIKDYDKKYGAIIDQNKLNALMMPSSWEN